MNRSEFLNEIKILQEKYKDQRTFFNNLKFRKDLLNELTNLTAFLPTNIKSSQRLYHVTYDITEPGKCTICESASLFKTFDIGYVKYCKKCKYQDPNRAKNREATCLEIYGVTHPSKNQDVKEKNVQTSLLRFGTKHSCQSAEVKDKIKQTNLEKRGVACSFQDPKVQQKSLETLKTRYNVTNASQIPESKEKKNKTNFVKFGNVEFLSSDYSIEKCKKTKLINFYNKLVYRLRDIVILLFTPEEYTGTKNKKYKFECVKCSYIFHEYVHNAHIPRCPICHPLNRGTSYIEKEIIELVRTYVASIVTNSKSVISPYELDIYIPEHNLAVEFNGLYYHSELSGKDKDYHLNKTKMCEEKGIQLIHIFEDEWIDKQEIVKSIIKNKLGLIDTKIYARKCSIKEVPSKEVQNFLLENHLQEPIYSKHNFGLYYNDELVYLICLSKPRFNKNYQFELIRSCSKINTQVVGGFDRLIKYAINTLSIESLISYVDRRYFNGSGYKNNWKFVRITEPGFYYADCHKIVRESRIKYQKQKLKKVFPECYDEILTEWEIMQLAGYDRIWDCGNLVFEYKV